MPVEDFIDFPVSDTFRGFLYERGLTPHPPADMGDYNIRALRDEIKGLRQELVELIALKLGEPAWAPQSDYGPPPPPSQNPTVKALPARRLIWNGEHDERL